MIFLMYIICLEIIVKLFYGLGMCFCGWGEGRGFCGDFLLFVMLLIDLFCFFFIIRG